jgi:hypothetical protein
MYSKVMTTERIKVIVEVKIKDRNKNGKGQIHMEYRYLIYKD